MSFCLNFLISLYSIHCFFLIIYILKMKVHQVIFVPNTVFDYLLPRGGNSNSSSCLCFHCHSLSWISSMQCTVQLLWMRLFSEHIHWLNNLCMTSITISVEDRRGEKAPKKVSTLKKLHFKLPLIWSCCFLCIKYHSLTRPCQTSIHCSSPHLMLFLWRLSVLL